MALLERLGDQLSPREVAVAARQVRSQVLAILPGNRLDLVFDRQLGRARITTSDQELREAVSHGRPVNVIALGERLLDVSDGFKNWTSSTITETPNRRQTGKRGVSPQSVV
jgi:hypothetical protein